MGMYLLYFQEIIEKQAPGLMREAERFLILSNIDKLWKEHLQALKFVQQAVGLRGYAQRDPLIEYKLEGYNLFLDMTAQIQRNVIYAVYQVLFNASTFSLFLEIYITTLSSCFMVQCLKHRRCLLVYLV
jgi:preprotein translocase subunit SecA